MKGLRCVCVFVEGGGGGERAVRLMKDDLHFYICFNTLSVSVISR